MRRTFLAPIGLLLTSLLLAGCGGEKDGYETPTPGQDVHTHEEPDPPHGGHLLHSESHNAVHLELTFDAEKREARLFTIVIKDDKWVPHVLKADEIEMHYEPEGADDEVEVVFAAVAPKDGAASEFLVSGDAIPADIKDEEDIVGHIHLEFDGKEEVYNVAHDHAHHDH